MQLNLQCKKVGGTSGNTVVKKIITFSLVFLIIW